MKTDLYSDLVNAAKRHNYIFHYTTLESLEKILINNSLRLSRLDIVNDIYENKRIDDIWKSKIYTSCFSYRESESYMFWKLYAGNEGVRLRFNSNFFIKHAFSAYQDSKCTEQLFPYINSDPSHKRNVDYSDWALRDITYAEIKYTNNFDEFIEFDAELASFFKNCVMTGDKKTFNFSLFPGLIKGIEWDSEDEVRLRVTLSYKGLSNSVVTGSPNPPFMYIYIPIEKALESMSITMNPWHCNCFETRLKNLLAQNHITKNCEVFESTMREQIKHK